MAFSTNMAASAGTRTDAPSRVSSLFRRFDAWRSQRREVARIAFELSCYSERELADLGLTRDDIASVANGEFQRS